MIPETQLTWNTHARHSYMLYCYPLQHSDQQLNPILARSGIEWHFQYYCYSRSLTDPRMYMWYLHRIRGTTAYSKDYCRWSKATLRRTRRRNSVVTRRLWHCNKNRRKMRSGQPHIQYLMIKNHHVFLTINIILQRINVMIDAVDLIVFVYKHG